MPLSKEKLQTLIEEVVLPFENIVFEDEKLRHFLKDDEIAKKHNFAIAKLTVSIFKDIQSAYGIIQMGVKGHQKAEVPKEYLKEYYGVYFRLCHEWNQTSLDANEIFEKNINIIQTYVFDAFKTEEETQESFFDFDSQKVNADIKRMHYKDDEKITAIEMFEQNILDEEDVIDILEVASDMEAFIGNVEGLIDSESIAKIEPLVALYARMFEKTLEFRDIGFSINNLSQFLQTKSEHILTPQNIKSADLVLKSIVEDLLAWTKIVIIDKSAIDIHYVDASLLANITQFEIMFTPKEQMEMVEENEFELF